MVKMDEAIGDKNCLGKLRGKKRSVSHFKNIEFWKYIRCILSAVTYEIKGHQLWGEIEKSVRKKWKTTIHRYVNEITYLTTLCCYLYSHHYCYNFY